MSDPILQLQLRTMGTLLKEAPLSIVCESYSLPVASNEHDTENRANQPWVRDFTPILHVVRQQIDLKTGPDFVDNSQNGLGKFPLFPAVHEHTHFVTSAVPRSKYFFASKADVMSWFMAEISTAVVAAFNTTNELIPQNSAYESLVLSDATTVNIPADIRYVTSTWDNEPATLAVGTILGVGYLAKNWIVDPGQEDRRYRDVSAEMRGLAYCFKTPFVFCFDVNVLVLFKFRAASMSELRSENCIADIWSFDRKTQAKWYRFALHGFIEEAWRKHAWFDRQITA